MDRSKDRQDIKYGNRYSSRKIIFLLLICCAGAAYLLWVRSGGAAVPCLFHELTGLKCPGCGITGMFEAISRLDLHAALNANPFLFATLPYLLFLILYGAYKWVRNERTGAKFEAAAAVYCIGLVLFGILRNVL